MSNKTVTCNLKRNTPLDIDFTGRWKVVNVDGDTKLKLECFFWREETWKRYTGEVEHVTLYSPNWFQRMVGKKPIIECRKVRESYKKRIHPLGYVDSDDLIIEETYDNMCSATDATQHRPSEDNT